MKLEQYFSKNEIYVLVLYLVQIISILVFLFKVITIIFIKLDPNRVPIDRLIFRKFLIQIS